MIYEPLVVLLLEDNYDDERLALRALRSCGLALCVRVARDGVEALRALGLDGSEDDFPVRPPDLVISDLKMPKLSGDMVLERVRRDERLKAMPFVMFSSSAETIDVDRCTNLGATAYCVKPVGYEEYIACAIQIARRWLSKAEKEREPFCIVDTPGGTYSDRVEVR